MTVTAGTLHAAVHERLQTEHFEQLLKAANVQIERIVSTGQTTPADTWFDQDWDEWVLLFQGVAELQIEQEAAPRRLEPGDYIFLPAHVRHRVTWTAPDQPTVWLAVHIDRPA